ncbi:MAG: hypothetical protein ACRDHD_04820 [Candidatus Limnocylindria bacterium]
MVRGSWFLLAIASVVVIVAVLQSPNDVDRSDEFWRTLHIRASEVEQYDSLEGMAKAADAVVVARIRSVSPGRVFGEFVEGPHVDDALAHYASITIEIDEVLAGALPAEDTQILVLEVMVPQPADLPALTDQIPTETSIYFLRSKEMEAQRLGLPDDDVKAEDGFYRLVVQEALLRVFDGAVHPSPIAERPFLVALEGRRMEDVVSIIRSAGARQPAG